MDFVNLEFVKAGLRKFNAALPVFAPAFFLSAMLFFAPQTYGQNNQTKSAPEKNAPEISSPPSAQNLPKVTRIDATALQNLIKRADGASAKPLLVNFWATWCDPCREEFPDLVKIDADYKNKIDFITISLDELSEIDGDVPKFLAQMKVTTPAFLLKTEDEESAISEISKNWQGGLPFTILYDARGAVVYTKQGKVKPEILRAQIDKILPSAQIQTIEPEVKNAPVISDLNGDGKISLFREDIARAFCAAK